MEEQATDQPLVENEANQQVEETPAQPEVQAPKQEPPAAVVEDLEIMTEVLEDYKFLQFHIGSFKEKLDLISSKNHLKQRRYIKPLLVALEGIEDTLNPLREKLCTFLPGELSKIFEDNLKAKNAELIEINTILEDKLLKAVEKNNSLEKLLERYKDQVPDQLETALTLDTYGINPISQLLSSAELFGTTIAFRNEKSYLATKETIGITLVEDGQEYYSKKVPGTESKS